MNAARDVEEKLPATERFRPTERLKKRSEFRQTERGGRRVAGRYLVVYGRLNDRACSRLGITASRRVGNAIRRNRWKRRIREVFRRNKESVPAGFDFVVIVKSKRTDEAPSFAQVRDELCELFQAATKPKKGPKTNSLRRNNDA